MRGVFLDLDTVDSADLDLQELEETVAGWRYLRSDDGRAIAQRIGGAQVVVSNKVVLDASAIEGSPQLELICIAATGTNNVDLEAAGRSGVVVSNVRAYATPSVVQHTFALMLALTTHLLDYRQAVREGRWQRSGRFCLLDYPVAELSGKTLGIVGLGELGRGVARVAEAFDMPVLVAQRSGKEAAPGRLPLQELLPRVDVLSLHCPLTPETRGLIGARELARMRRDALLINTARGGIVDEAALAEALRLGRIGGAGIDVLSEEPPPPDNPLLDPDLPNLIVTPHTAWASRETRQRLIGELAQNIRAYLGGEPRNRVA